MLLGETGNLPGDRAAGQARECPVPSVAAAEGLQHRQPGDVPVEDDRLVVVRTPPHHPHRTHPKMLSPARSRWLWGIHSGQSLCGGQAASYRSPAGGPAGQLRRSAIDPGHSSASNTAARHKQMLRTGSLERPGMPSRIKRGQARWILRLRKPRGASDSMLSTPGRCLPRRCPGVAGCPGWFST